MIDHIESTCAEIFNFSGFISTVNLAKPETMLRLDNKVVLITGLGQTTDEGWGIGAAIAYNLSKQGAIIFGGNRSLASAKRTKSRIESAGGVCDVQETNVADSASVKALVEACIQRHGRIDILVNNVGKSEPGCPATMAEDVWDSQVDLNLKSVYLTCHYVLPIMENQDTGGAVVNVSSIAGLRYIGKPQVAYSATKAAIMQFTKGTAVIYAGKNVRLNTVVPGLIYTPYTREMAKRYAPEGDEKEYMRKRDGQVPMGRMGDAWDVANAVLFLAADESKYITGQELVVDGGITSSTGRV
jgi:NAD(P)-dependent dehydrogenase (short-subunit alcohol dehydrogenase family)